MSWMTLSSPGPGQSGSEIVGFGAGIGIGDGFGFVGGFGIVLSVVVGLVAGLCIALFSDPVKIWVCIYLFHLCTYYKI